MHDNKVSEKAIWEGSITPDEAPITASQMQTQSQMMFCYKCNNVIPGDSKFCPCCKIELYTVCPKCGVKYSSQYLICNQCGTDRLEYLQLQREEQERIEKIKREERIRQEKLERERQEVERKQKEAAAERERQESLRRYEQQENERKQKEAYLKENDEIMKTQEYETTYSILSEALTALDNKKNKHTKIAWLLHSLTYIYLVISYIIDLANRIKGELVGTIFTILFLIGIIGLVVNVVSEYVREWQEEYLMQYALSDSRYQESLITTDLVSMVWYQRHYLSKFCIIAYRKKYGLPINKKWHDLRS